MYKTISNEIIRKFNPCYDPSKFITDENEKLTVKQWVEKYRNIVPTKDIIWLLCRKDFMSDKKLRLFAVWCAREALKLVKKPDERSVEACNVAERYANGEATMDELLDARVAANDAARVAANAYDAAADAAHTDYAVYAAAEAVYAARDAADVAAYATRAAIYAAADAAAYATRDAANDAARVATNAYDAARSLQIDKLLSYFEK